MLRLLIGTVFALCLATPEGMAQGTRKGPTSGLVRSNDAPFCGPHRRTIVSLADKIINQRSQLTGFLPGRFGPLAIYVKLRQEDMSLSRGLALIDRVAADGRRPPQLLDVLRLTFAIHHLGVREGLASSGASAVETFARENYMVPRSVILADGGKSFFQLLAKVRADPELNETFEKTFFQGRSLATMLSDLDDDFKLQFAQRAETADELVLAGLMFGGRRDLDPFFAFLDRHPDEPALPGPIDLESHIMTVFTQTRAQIRPGDTAADLLRRQQIFEVLRASARMGGIAWLSILLNQTGDYSISRTAREFTEAIEDGTLDPVTDMEAAWLFLRNGLARDLGQDDLARHLGSFDLGSQVRHYSGAANDVLDRMQAIVALGEFVESGVMPERPDLLSAGFDWDGWMQIAKTLQSGQMTGLTETDKVIAAELLFRAGDIHEAINFVDQLPDAKTRLPIYRDFMKRLDQRCDGFTEFPGSALILGGQVLFRFD